MLSKIRQLRKPNTKCFLSYVESRPKKMTTCMEKVDYWGQVKQEGGGKKERVMRE
jgi:hypothetical protein